MRARRYLLSLAIVCFTAFGQSKIDPSLAGATGNVPVVILLNQQPHASIVSQAKAGFSNQIRNLEQALQNLPDGSPARDPLVDQLDRLTTQLRTAIRNEIQIRTGPSQLAAQARWGLLGATKFKRHNLTNAVSCRMPATALAALQNDTEVGYVLRDRQMEVRLDVSTAAIGAPAFWNTPLNITGTGVKVGVIDTGVTAAHLALTGAVTDQQVFHTAATAAPLSESQYADDGTVNDNQGHGTHVAGIVASRGTPAFPNHRGVARGASIVNLKAGYRTSTGGGAMYYSDLLDAIDWGYFNANVTIFNYSFGGSATVDDPIENQILDDVIETYGIFFAAAAGNGGVVNVPGSAYNTTQVGAMDDKNTVSTSDDTVATFSSYGPTPGGRSKPDIVAPGVAITSLLNDTSSFISRSGTSMATPHIAGSAALLRQSGVLDPRAIKALLIHSASTAGWTTTRGWGYVNLTNAAAQRTASSIQSIPPATTRFYRLTHPGGTLKATMVWERFFTVVNGSAVSNFNNLDMTLYNRYNNAVVGALPSTLSNVEQVSTTSAGNYVLRLQSPATLSGGITQQEYAFVLTPTTVTLTPAAGPNVSISCVTPAGAQMNVALQLTCTATNSGDLEAYTVLATVTQPAGWAAVPALNFGTVSPATSKTLSWTLTPKTWGSNITLPVSLTGAAFGNAISASTSVTFNILPPVYNISGRVTLNTSTGPGVQGVTVTLSGGASSSAVTDVNGNYAFLGLPFGVSYTVTPARISTKFYPVSSTIAALNANTAVNFVATSIVSISGRVTDASTGLGVANVTVRTLGTVALSAITNSTGNYTIANVNQGGAYSVIPTPPANTRLNVAKLVYLPAATMADVTNADFTVSSITAVLNNESAGATPVGALPAYIVQAVAAATPNAADPLPSCAFERGNDSVWYSYTADFTGLLDLSTFGSNYDTLLAAYTGATPSAATEAGCSDDFAGSLYSKMTLPVVSGQTYKFLISGFNAGTGGSTLVFTVSRVN